MAKMMTGILVPKRGILSPRFSFCSSRAPGLAACLSALYMWLPAPKSNGCAPTVERAVGAAVPASSLFIFKIAPHENKPASTTEAGWLLSRWHLQEAPKGR